MRVPLSWLRDFAPFDRDPVELAAALDDLGLVVEELIRVGEGLDDVVVARVAEVAAIEGADRIRRVTVDDGSDQVEVVCGAWNFAVGDLVPLARVGAVLPGGVAIGRRRMKGVASDGMLCSGRELALSDDAEGIMVLAAADGARPGQPLAGALGIEPDVVFDVAVEANRPDASGMAGVARDLAARLGLPFGVPAVADLATAGGTPVPAVRTAGPAAGELASLRVEDTGLCPRFTARVITGVRVGPSPTWLSRRLVLAGMRSINNVVDASNYVMLEIGQPTHPYDLDRLPGTGLVVRRAAPGETLTTLDGVVRTLGEPGPGFGDDGGDCLICDAHGSPVGIAGIMGGAASEIGLGTTRVLLEAASFDPMAVARTSKRLGLRTEASARFERGSDPEAVGPAVARFSDLVALTGGPDVTVAPGDLEVRGALPAPVELEVSPSRISALLGRRFAGEQIVRLLVPLGFEAEPVETGQTAELAEAGESGGADDAPLRVRVPTYRPDVRPSPMGEADLAEEVARTVGYSSIGRRTPSWPQPGRLTAYQRDRRQVREVLCGLGCTEAWTATFVTEADQLASGFAPPHVAVTNPLVEVERFLRSSMAPGLVRAVVRNGERGHPHLRLFEIGSVFYHPDHPGRPAGGQRRRDEAAPSEERLSVVLAGEGDDAWRAVAAWRTLAGALRLEDWVMGERPSADPLAAVVHPYRSAVLACPPPGRGRDAGVEPRTGLGVVGELGPAFVASLGLVDADGRPRTVGWLDVDLGWLLDPTRVPRLTEQARPVSRFPPADIDLALVVDEAVPAGAVERTLRTAAGDLVESVELFDVYRGPSVRSGARSLAFHLRFRALDRTLTDGEVAELRTRCVTATEQAHGAVLR